jgi:ribonuclease HI
MVKLTTDPNYGVIYIYYKPTKDTYLLKKKLKNSRIEEIIDTTWNLMNDCKIYSAKTGIYEAFVDGSFTSGMASYGAIIYLGNKIKAKLFGIIKNKEYIKFRQFIGELKSVTKVIKWCEVNYVKRIRINYDYLGIENFATGTWKARNIISKKYVNFLINTKIKIEWRHIKSHSGNIGNNSVDLLAKKILLIKK